ncbi:hypothetical protein V2J09_005493 [Rumex salicifolius]
MVKGLPNIGEISAGETDVTPESDGAVIVTSVITATTSDENADDNSGDTASQNDVEIEAEEGELNDETENQAARGSRTRRAPGWLRDYVSNCSQVQPDMQPDMFALFTSADPATFEEAVKKVNWKKAMNEEINAIERNEWRSQGASSST